MKYLISLFIIALFFNGCVSTKAPVTGRNQVILVSEQETLTTGLQSYKKFLSESKISNNIQATKMIKKIGQKIALASDKKDFKWEFNLVENEAINAFCLPGGKVVVYTGILKVAKNEDQLATVMSHEIAHALARHGAERMSHNMISNGIFTIGNIIVKSKAPQYTSAFKQAYGLGSKFGFMLPYSREHEYEADEIGIHLMYKAGYNIDEALKFWQNMQKQSKSTQPEFMSTHPHTENRIKNISKIIGVIHGKQL